VTIVESHRYINRNAACLRIDKRVAGVSDSDEVWCNAGDGNYYLAAHNNSGGPMPGMIDAANNTLRQLLPTINVAGKANVLSRKLPHR
jgi:hypothetical protein